MELTPSSRACVCPACQHTVVPDRPRWYWRLAVAASWAVLVAVMVAMCFAAILVTALFPFILFVGAGLLSTTHDEAFRPALCPRCRRAIPPGTPAAAVTTPATAPAGGSLAPGVAR